MNIAFIAVIMVVLIVIALLMRGRLNRFRRSLGRLVRTIRAITKIDQKVEFLYQLSRKTSLQIEPAPPLTGSWELIGGDGQGWPSNTFYKVRGLAIHEGKVFASLTGPKADGPVGEVWCLDGKTWSRIGGGTQGSWKSTPSFVDHLFSTEEGELFAAEKTGVWQLKGDCWTRLCEGLELNTKCGPYCFTEWDGQVVMGQWGCPRVALLNNDDKWHYLPDPDGGWGQGVRTIYCLASWNGYLYAGTGTGKFAGPSSTVWRYDGHYWEKIGGHGVRGSWRRDGIPFVLSLTVFNNKLVTTLSRPEDMPASASNVWIFDGKKWGALTVGSIPYLMSNSLIMNDSIVYNDRLVVATGHNGRHPAELWELCFEESWRPITSTILESPGEGEGGWWVYRLCTDGDHLYASTAGHQGAARVLRFTPCINKEKTCR